MTSSALGVLMAFYLFTFQTSAQTVRCYSSQYDSIRHANNPNLQSNEDFEAWLDRMIEEKKRRAESQHIVNGVYYIPIVVHVIHSNAGGGIGGDNLSQVAIQSQIDVLNEDFRRIMGTNGYNTHPDGADTQIEFCLARRRPDGSAFPAGEDGINRVYWDDIPGLTGAPPYNTGVIDGTIKPWSTTTQFGGWDAADYMNFWVVQISGGILGYAQFPTTVLGGMSCTPDDVNTDGVVMTTGSIGKSAVTGFPGPYNEGRTATHEIGHWLGLRHIWGDGGCGIDDFCLDTPESDASNFGCPTGHVSCGSTDMVENYMDYTDDLCMNIFTNDQKMRMRTVLENSPIRFSLINSDACVPPTTSDASIVGILSPLGDNCPGTLTPEVTLRNRGGNNLTSATIVYTVDGVPAGSFAWTGTLTPGSETNVTLPGFTAPLGSHYFQAYSTLPNVTPDPDPTYDTSAIYFAVSNGYQPNYIQDFEAGVFPPDVRWAVDNLNGDCFEWVGQPCTSSTGVSNNVAALMTNYQNGTNQSEDLYTPYFILPCNSTQAELVFDKAYSRRIASSNDRLRVQVSDDCGATWTTIYDQSGAALASVGNNNSYWIPSAAGDWDNVVLDLMPYVTGTSSTLQFRFRATNAGNGGNLYIDNIQFTAQGPAEVEVDVTGTQVLDDGFYDFGAQPIGAPVTATFTVTNNGNSPLVLTPPITITGDAEFALNSSFGSTTVAPGGTTTFSIDFTATGPGPFAANVVFLTNDCDEGTYNFVLAGTGDVTPPTASFTSNPSVICEGGTVTYTDASTGATTWSWTFPGGSPASATGAGPHTVTYNTAGSYGATLDVTNPYGSDTDNQINIVTVNATGTTFPLPITEGFTGAAFAPANWSINNGGNAITWERDAANGNAPTAGNSAVIDNFNTNTSGDQDDLVMPPADFTGLSSAQLQFDVAYARYDATFNDRLDVLISDDCGGSWTIVYSKASDILATEPDQTGGYTNPSVWRTETIDLSAYVGSPKVDILFRNISGWGQYLYLDNVNLTGVVSSATADFTAAPDPACVGQTVTFTDASTNATSWDWNFGAGATPATATGVGPHTVTYSTDGTKSVSLSINGGADVSNQNVTINPLDDATFSYASADYCANDADPTPTITGLGGGTFSSTAGLSINTSTGQIDLSASTPGSYTVTYTTAGTCPNSSDVVVNINANPAAPVISAGGPTTFCAGGSVDLTSSQATGNVWSTTETTQTINIVSSGSYTVTYTDGNGCSATSAPTVVTMNANPAAPTISAGGPTTFCDGGSVALTSSEPSGNLWSTTETTQTISATTSGSYTVTYTDGNGCSATSAPTVVTVNATPATPVISAGGPTTFCDGGSVALTSSQATGNVWSTTETTQTINVTTSGSYSVTYTDANGCSATSAPTVLTVNANPAVPTISAVGPTTFCDAGSVALTSSQASGNIWSTTETTQTISATTSGSYTVTYTDGNGCSATSAPTVVTVNANPIAPTITAGGPTTFCDGGSVALTSSQSSGNVWSTTETTQTINVATSGSYTVTYTDGNGCSATSAATVVTVNATPATPVISAGGPTTFCDGGSVALTSSQASGNVWSTTETTQTINVTTSGTYTVTYTDGNGCSATSTPTVVTVNANPATPVVTAGGPTTFCDGGSVTLTSSAPTGNLWSSAETTQTIGVSTSGTYTLTYTDGNGCSATSAPVVVTVNPAPVIALGTVNNPSACVTATGSIEITGTGTGVVGWTGTTTGNSGTVTLPYTITSLAAGNYNIEFVDVSTCTSNTLNQTLTDPTPPATPTITAGGPTTFCDGGSVTLTSSYTTGNNWSTTETTQSIVVSTSGTYAVTYTDGGGCTATSAPIVVIVNANPITPVVTASGPTTFCAGGSVDLTSSEGTGNLWSSAETTQTIGVSTSGTYTLTYTDGNGCSATSAPTLVTVNAMPSAPIVTASGATTFCDGGSVDLTSSYLSGNVWSTTETTGTISVSISDSYTVTYTDGNGCSATSAPVLVSVNPLPAAPVVTASGATTFCDGGSVDLTSSYLSGNVWSTTETTQSISATNSGSYNVTYTDGNGCSATSAPTVVTVYTVLSAPVVTASGATTFCDGGSVVLTSLEPSGNLWSTTETSQSISVSTAGSYTVTYTDGNGCSATSAPTVVTVNAIPSVPVVTASGATTFCDGGSVDLTSSYLSDNVWSTTETTGSISVSSSGSYTVTYTDGNGCSATSAPTVVTVNANPAAPTVTASGPTTFCEGGSVDLTSSYLSGNVWSTTETTGSITVSASGSYTVTYTDGNGCSATSASTDVTVNPLPSLSIGTLADVCLQEVSFTLTGATPAGGTYAGSGVSAGIFNPAAAGTGTHTITYSYTDLNGCSNSDQTDIIVNDCASIEDLNEAYVSVYPNPANSIVTVVSSDEQITMIEIYDATGRLVNRLSTNADEIAVDVSEYANGIYSINIYTTGSTFRTRVVKQ
jgi:PKD repeat protein